MSEQAVRIGDITLAQAAPAEAEGVLAEAWRYCPDVPGDAAERVHVAAVPFYEDYRLVRIQWPATVVVGFYAPGDFRPLDRTGQAIERLNAVAPLRLTRDNVLSYALLRLACEMAGDATDGNGGPTTPHAQVLLSPGALIADHAALPAEAQAYLDPPRLDEECGGDARAYRVSAPAVLRTEAGLGLVRVSAMVAGNGQLAARRNKTLALPPGATADASSLEHIVFPHRLAAGQAAQRWRPADPEERSRWIAALDGYGVKPADDTLIRFADFAEARFYHTFTLMEVVTGWPTRPRRSYALVREVGGERDIRPINGSSTVIHDANAEPGELALDTRAQADAYLRFFCWAVHGDGGPFLLPRAFREVPLAYAPDDAVRESMRKLQFALTPVSPDDPVSSRYQRPAEPSHRLRGIVAYESAAFEAWFDVTREAGLIEMVEDNPLSFLDLSTERYGRGDLFPLRLSPRATEHNGGHGSTGRSGDDEPTDPPEPPAARTPIDVSAELFMRRIVEQGEASDLRVTEPIVLRASVRTLAGGRPVRVERCTFEREVSLGGLRGGSAWEFRGCSFEMGVTGREASIRVPLAFIQCNLSSDGGGEEAAAVDLGSAQMRGGLTLTRCQIGGRIFAAGMRLDGGLCIRGCRVGPSLSDLVDPIRMGDIAEWSAPVGAVPAGFVHVPAVSLYQATITGDLEITADVPHRDASASARDAFERAGDRAADAPATVVQGAVQASGVRVYGSTSLFGFYCRGDLEFRHGRYGKGLMLSCATAGGVEAQFRAGGVLSLSGASVAGQLDLGMSIIEGGASLYEARVTGPVDLLGLKVRGDLQLTFARINGFIGAFRRAGYTGPRQPYALEVGGDLELSGARLRAIELRGVKVDGAVRAVTGTFGRLFLTIGVEHAGSQDADGCWHRASTVGAIEFTDITVHENLELCGIQVVPPLNRERRERFQQLRPYGCVVTGAKVGGDVRLSMDEPSRVLARRWDATLASGHMRWSRRASGENPMLLGPPSCEDIAAAVWGGIDLRANAITGKLDLRNVRTDGPILLNDTSVGRDILLDSTYEQFGFGVPALRTRCRGFEAEMMRCEGDTDWTGLTTGGGLRVRGATVTGELLLAPQREDRRRFARGPHASDAEITDDDTGRHTATPAWYAHIRGGLDLTAVEANHLVLSGNNLVDSETVVLERGRFSRLEIVAPTPGPINLSRIKVERWQFGGGHRDADASADDGTPGDYTDVLSRMSPFDRSVWLDVETMFRNHAREQDANEVYVAMRHKQRTEHPIRPQDRRGGFRAFIALSAAAAACIVIGLVADIGRGGLGLAVAFALLAAAIAADRRNAAWRRPLLWHVWDRVHSATIGYGTRVWRPMVCVWLPVFIGSCLVFSNPDNVRATTSALEVLGAGETSLAIDPGASPEMARIERTAAMLGARWTLRDGLAVALRYHVPMAPAGTHERWEAGRRRVALGVTAEQYAFLASIVSWVAWPVFLIGAAAKVFRGKRE